MGGISELQDFRERLRTDFLAAGQARLDVLQTVVELSQRGSFGDVVGEVKREHRCGQAGSVGEHAHTDVSQVFDIFTEQEIINVFNDMESLLLENKNMYVIFKVLDKLGKFTTNVLVFFLNLILYLYRKLGCGKSQTK